MYVFGRKRPLLYKQYYHAGVSSNKNDKFEHVHMQKNQHFKEKHSFPWVIAAW